MDSLPLFASLVCLFYLTLLVFKRRWDRIVNLPPSPWAIPVIGHLHHLVKPVPVQHTFKNLSNKLGPVFSLRLGSRLVVVVSSHSAVEECLTTNDIILANRPKYIFGKYIGYNNTIVVTASNGDHWRNLRRIMALEMFSSSRLNAFSSVRREEVDLLLRTLYRHSRLGFAKVELQTRLSEMTFNLIMQMLVGKRYYGDSVVNYEEGKEFQELVVELLKYASMNLADYFPVLRWIDYQKFEKNLEKFQKKMDAVLQGLIEEHRRDKSINSMIQNLLSIQESEPEYYTDDILKGIIVVIILAGTDTSSVTMEWAMTLLLNHPDVLAKARFEINSVVGEDRLIEESDIPQLKYLQAIVQETMRMFPPVPVLLPHMASDDCKVATYDIPRGTTVLVNIWAIHRDPKIWDDPTSFRPERFLNEQVDKKKLTISFGMGRRACPGDGMALRVVGLALGSLIQCFEWKRVDETKPIDLSVRNGAILYKLEPLEAVCKSRDILKNFVETSKK